MACPRLLRWLLAAVLLSGAVATAEAAPASADELSLKVAIAFNLVLFTQWPDEAGWPPGSPLVLCADAASPWWPPLRMLQERPVRQAQVVVRDPARLPDGTHGCHVLLLDGALRATVGGRAQLLIADGPDAPAGWTVRLGRAGDRIVFDIDLAAARASRLQISSKVLRLAREVRE